MTIFSHFINKTTIVGIASSAYLYSVYTFMPDYIYNPLITIVPIGGAIFSLLLPRLFKKSNQNNTKDNLKEDNNNLKETKDENIENNTEQVNKQNEINITLIEEIIDRKIAKIIEENNNKQQQLEDSINSIKNMKNELNDVKNSIKELKNAFETTLVDLKTFQTEMSNPLNFMRKYFDSIDVKNLSDPTLPLQIDNNSKLNQIVELKDEQKSNNKDNELDILHAISTHHALNNIPLTNNLANIIELISSISYFIEEFGPNYKQVLSTQCKILRIDKEHEEMIYSIADILYSSGTTGEAYIESLYNLAKVMGINDNSLNLIRHKLRKKRNNKRRR